ncbi:MAG TPA: acyl-CoA dehydrogenase family protein [Novosphingobium sp.]|nr:acyl-CoA dehydrogenase family protein [Novosphingobium sp.]
MAGYRPRVSSIRSRSWRSGNRVHFAWNAEQTAFRSKIDDFLRANLPDDWDEFSKHGPASPALTEFARHFCRSLADNGMLFPHWPKEIGGGGASPPDHQNPGGGMWGGGGRGGRGFRPGTSRSWPKSCGNGASRAAGNT